VEFELEKRIKKEIARRVELVGRDMINADG
jgi:hypothetical protein